MFESKKVVKDIVKDFGPEHSGNRVTVQLRREGPYPVLFRFLWYQEFVLPLSSLRFLFRHPNGDVE